ncbi:MAG: DUF3106 domain-containing protein [Burkholderiales bacterium]
MSRRYISTSAHPWRRLSDSSRFAVSLCILLALNAWSQTPSSLPSASKAAASVISKPVATKQASIPAEGPTWLQLSAPQQQALRPLQIKWDSLPELQKRKWLALAPNYHARPPAEQAKLHSRMTEWANLSTQQRAQARLNFAEAGTLSAEQRKAKWEAYQALKPEDKKKLIPAVPVKPAGAAAAIKPVSTQKLADVAPSKPGGHASRAPKTKDSASGAVLNTSNAARSLAPASTALPAAVGNAPATVTEPASALAPATPVQTN